MSGSTFATVSAQSPVVRDHPLNQGRLSWWLPLPGRLGGATLPDIAGGNHATILGGPTWCRGFTTLDSAVRFVPNLSTPQYALAPCPTLSAYTLACRVVFDDLRFVAGTGHNNSLIKNWGHSAQVGYFHWGMTSANESATPGLIRCYVNATGGVGQATTAASLSVGVPYHLAVTVGGGTIRLYINGQADGVGSYLGTLFSNSSRMAFGVKMLDDQVTPEVNPDSDALLSGTLGDCSLWDRPLSAAEIAQLFDQAKRGYPDLIRRSPGLNYRASLSGFLPSWLGSQAVLGTGIC